MPSRNVAARPISWRISQDKRVNSLGDPWAMLAYTWLIPSADNRGRLEGDPELVASMLFPRLRDVITPEKMAGILQVLHDAGLVCWYEVNGERYLQFPVDTWKRHQRLVGNMKDESDFPEVPADVYEGWIKQTRINSYIQVTNTYIPVSDAPKRGQNGAKTGDEDGSPGLEGPDAKAQHSPSMNQYIQVQNQYELVTLKGREGKGREGKRDMSTDGQAVGSTSPSQEPTDTKDEIKARIAQVMDHYNAAFRDLWKRPLRLTEDRKAKIKARLATFSVEELCKAIDNLRKSRFHCGENDAHRVYATPEFLFRNDGQVDKWLAAKEPGETEVEEVDPGEYERKLEAARRELEEARAAYERRVTSNGAAGR